MRKRSTTVTGSSTFAASAGLRSTVPALVALLTAMAAVPGNAVAQDSPAVDPSLESEGSADDTLVARFELAEGALHGVTSSVELIAALREHLTADLAMPLKEPLVINLHGLAGRGEGGRGPVYHFGLSPLGVGLQGEVRMEDFSYALAVRESHGDDFPPDGDEWEEFDDDWDEEEAWNSLVEALDVGLPQSTAEFRRPGEGKHLGLSVTAVHLREFTLTGPSDSAWWGAFSRCCPDLKDQAVLLIRPEPRYQSMMTVGDEAGLEVPARLNVLAVELAPAPAGDGPADPASGSPEPTERSAAPDAEVLGLTEMFQAVCHAPEIAISDAASTSEVVIAGESHTGEALYAVDGDADRTIKLAGGESDARFCLLLMWRGGPSASGTYRIRRLAMDLMESESNPADPWMVASLSIGADGTTFVVPDSGSVEITAMEPSVRGHFEFVGWKADGGSRGEEVEVSGSFDAAPTDR